MKNKIFLLLVLLALGLAACAPQSAPSIPTPLPTSMVAQKPTYTVQRGTVAKVLELRGRVSAVMQEDLFFGTNGVVDDVLVSRGDTVEAGQVLAHLTERAAYEVTLADARLELIKAQKALDALTEEAELRSAEALVDMLGAKSALDKAKKERAGLELPRASEITLLKAEAIYAMAELNLKEARKQWTEVARLRAINPERFAALTNLSSAIQERDRALANLNWYRGHATEEYITAIDADLALLEVKHQEAVVKYNRLKDGPDPYDVALAEASLARAQVTLDKAQVNLDSLTITAPFDGEVLSLALTPGMQVTAFKTVLTLVDPAGLEITLLPTSSELAEISVGQPTLIRLPNRPGQELTGVVRHLPLPTSNTSAGQGTDQSVRVSFDDSSTLLTMGEVATVIIQLEERDNVLWIPPAALRTFQGRDFVIIQDGDVQRRVDLRLGLKSQDRIEVLEGLGEGQVILGP